MSERPNQFHAVIQGRVQGVGYRVYARDCAGRHGITGWVRNLRDGCVEIHAEGDELELTEFLTDLYRGPVLSHVGDVRIDWNHEPPRHQSFEIVR